MDQPAFTLQPVILEYVTDRLVGTVCQELVDGQPRLVHSHALVEATAKEYVQRSQERLIATPLLEGLAGLAAEPEQAHLAVQLLAAASALRVQMGTPVRPADQSAVEHVLATARATLGADAFAAVWSAAGALPLEQIHGTMPSAATFDALPA